MINKILHIKELGIFNEHGESPEFRRYNLIYGWNGGGKTTLSRLFVALNTGIHVKYPNLEYKIETSDGKISQKEIYSRKVMVFNKEYIEDNAPSLENPTIPSKHIFILGKEDKSLVNEIKMNIGKLKLAEDALTKNDPKQGIISLSKQLTRKQSEYSDLFTNIASKIASLRSYSGAIRSYKKPDAVNIYKKMTKKMETNLNDIKINEEILKQVIQDPVIDIDIKGTRTEINKLKGLHSEIKVLLNTVIEHEAIKRLNEKPDIAEWVELGVLLHTKYKSNKCEYCKQEITKERIKELSKHFNEQHKQLIKNIDFVNDNLNKSWSFFNDLKIPEKTAIYKDLQFEFEKNKNLFENTKKLILDQIRIMEEKLKSKSVQADKKIQLDTQIDFESVTAILVKIRLIIKKHNFRTKKFTSSQDESFEKLENYLIGSIYDKAKSIEKEIKTIENEMGKKQNEVIMLKQIIEKYESKLRNTKDGCDALNKILIDLLGRDEIRFEDSDIGYIIRRNKEIAKDISEGEKTTIAFAHFIVNLTNKDFDLKEGIIIIDDPISSLDLDSIHKVTTLIGSKLKKSHQLILMTHNYDFFNHIKEWFRYDKDINSSGIHKDKEINGQILMIKNPFDKQSGNRVAQIAEIDPLLRDYESEYHYLFKKLLTFEKDLTEDTEGTIAAVYDYPNIARKLLECFLSFKVPASDTFYVKLRNLKKNNDKISAEEIEDVYSFVNSHSHLDTKTGLIQFDPTLAPNGKSYIDKVLKLIFKSDKDHYEAMVKLVTN